MKLSNPWPSWKGLLEKLCAAISLVNKESRLDGTSPGQKNVETVHEFNTRNGISQAQRANALNLFVQSNPEAVAKLIIQYTASMNQDLEGTWQALKPPCPEVVCGDLPEKSDKAVDILGMGGMFAYLNVLYQAHKRGGNHCVVTNPHDIFTFSGWTIHPEEDMDQRLIEMFQTRRLVFNEMKRLTGFSEGPESLRFKSFKIDYSAALSLLRSNPKEFLKVIKVASRYALFEYTDKEQRYARINLLRNAATLKALEEMGRVGDDPGKDVVNLCGRVVFEVADETPVNAKKRLKADYGLEGRELTPEEVTGIYGDEIRIIEDMRAGRIRAALYKGGYFLAGYKDNAIQAMKQNHIKVYDNARVTKITLDPKSGKHAVAVRTSEGREITVIATKLLAAFGGYEEDVIPVDGVSTLFVVRTVNERYRIHPTGMGEGGTIHIVPVWTIRTGEDTRPSFYHLGKATNGAIMGRDPAKPKLLGKDKSFLLHLEMHLKRIIPPGSTFMWLAATECGRPVSAEQGYLVTPLKGKGEPAKSFEATGGCGLGGNTAIIPEVQATLGSSTERERD